MNIMRQRQKPIIYLSLAAALLTVVLSRLWSQPSAALPEMQLVTVTKGKLDINVNLIGELDAARTHIVSSALKGDKGKIIYLVEEGSAVAEGDMLVRFDPTPFETEVHRLTGELRSLNAAREAARQMLAWEKNQTQREIQAAGFDRKVAELELRRLVDGEGPLQLAQYKNELEQAREEYERHEAYIADLKQLAEQGIDSSGERLLAQRKVAQLSEIYQSARQRYDSYKEHVLPTAIAAARVRAEKAAVEIDQVEKGAVFKVGQSAANLAEIEGKRETVQAALEQARAELGKTTILAPFSGIAIHYEMFRDGRKRKPRVGDLVWQNQPLLYLPEIETMIVKTRIREVDLHKIAMQQTCTVGVDAFPNEHYTGRITRMGMLADERLETGTGEKFFQLIVTLDDENRDLRPGMTARVNVSGNKTNEMLYVPIHTVFREGGDAFCFRALDDGRFLKTSIRTGRYNEDHVEIIQGLRQGDTISAYLPAPARIMPTDADDEE